MLPYESIKNEQHPEDFHTPHPPIYYIALSAALVIGFIFFVAIFAPPNPDRAEREEGTQERTELRERICFPTTDPVAFNFTVYN